MRRSFDSRYYQKMALNIGKSHCTIMRFIFRIDRFFLSGRECHSPSERFERIDKLAQYLSHKICKAVFLSPTNNIHFSDRQHFFSGHKWCSPFVRFERIDNLNTMHLNHSRWSFIFLSPPNEIHLSDRQLYFSGREWCSPFVRFVRIDNL